jgi:hypothetical protein
MIALALSLTHMFPVLRPTACPWTVVLLVAVLAGIAMGYLSWFWPGRSDNSGTRNRLRARGMELLLHDGSFGSTVSTLRDIWRETRPLLIAEIPLTTIGIIAIGIPAIWLANWIEMRPLEQGQTAIVEAIVNPSSNVQGIHLEASEGLAVETSPLRFEDTSTVSWRIRVSNPSANPAWIELKTSISRTRMPVYVNDDVRPKFQAPVDQGGRKLTMHVRDNNTPVEKLSLIYPTASLTIGEHPIPWLIVYVVVSWLFAWIVKRIRRKK